MLRSAFGQTDHRLFPTSQTCTMSNVMLAPRDGHGLRLGMTETHAFGEKV